MHILDRRWRRLTLRPLLTSFKSLLHHKQSFSSVNSFCVFVGQPRSGTTLLSALLDAHPHVIMAQECNILSLLNLGLPRQLAFQALYESSLQFSRLGRRWNGHCYKIEDQEEKFIPNITAVGIKHASPNAKFFGEHAHGREDLMSRLGIPVRALHLIRNPFDVIASSANRRAIPMGTIIDWYEELDFSIKKALIQFPEDQKLCIYVEELISDPSYWLSKASSFLECPFTEKLMNNCTAVVWKEPKLLRKAMTWQSHHIARITRIIAKNELLSRYTL